MLHNKYPEHVFYVLGKSNTVIEAVYAMHYSNTYILFRLYFCPHSASLSLQ